MSDSLRSKLIRLAHSDPSLRPHVLPLLTKQAGALEDAEQALQDHQDRRDLDMGIDPYGRAPDLIKEMEERFDRFRFRDADSRDISKFKDSYPLLHELRMGDKTPPSTARAIKEYFLDLRAEIRGYMNLVKEQGYPQYGQPAQYLLEVLSQGVAQSENFERTEEKLMRDVGRAKLLKQAGKIVPASSMHIAKPDNSATLCGIPAAKALKQNLRAVSQKDVKAIGKGTNWCPKCLAAVTQ